MDVTISTMEDMAITLTVPVATNRPLITVTLKSPPMHGTLTQCSTTSASVPCSGASVDDKTQFIYTPAMDYNGADTIVVTLDNGDLQRDATIHITVTPVNDAPVANPDSFAVAFNTMATFQDATLLMNDTDVDSTTLTIVDVTPAGHGTVTHTGTAISFTPETNYQGLASFGYKISDGTSTAVGNVTVTVGMNTPPVAVADTVTTPEDVAIAIPAATLLANDTDADHQTLALDNVSSPVHGTVALVGQTVTFTPEANFRGTASFVYGVTDGADVTNGNVTVTVTAVNHPPTVQNVTGLITAENGPATFPAATFLSGAMDIDGDTLRITAVGGAVHGTVSLPANAVGDTVLFTPENNYFGPASFTFTVSDGTATATGTASLTITHVNQAPVGVNDIVTTGEDVALPIAPATLTANDLDPDNDPLVITAVTNPTNGTVTLVSGTITFTPAPLFSGVAGFDYTMSDGLLTGSAHVTVNVIHGNHAPMAVDDVLGCNEDSFVVGMVLTNDIDIDGDVLSVSAVTQGAHGAVTFAATSVTYTPVPLFHAADAFTYTASDGNGGMSSATVTVAVTHVNHAPVAMNDSIGTPEDTAVAFDARINDTDIDGDVLTVTGVTAGTHGVTSILPDGRINYAPDLNYNGPDAFVYTISDGAGGTAAATVVVNVTPVNDAPVAQDDGYANDQAGVIVNAANGVLINDHDVENSPLTAMLITDVQYGTLTLNPDGSFIYIPNCGGQGSGAALISPSCIDDSFTYVAFDGALQSNVVTVYFSGGDMPPVAVPDAYTADIYGSFGCGGFKAGAPHAIGAPTAQPPGTPCQSVLDNDYDPDGGPNPLIAFWVTQPNHGYLYFNYDGTFYYYAGECFTGTDTFTYEAFDGLATSNIVTVTIDVPASNGCGG